MQELKEYSQAIEIFEQLMNHYKGISRNNVSSRTWKKWESVYPEIISSLILAYQGGGQNDKAEAVLNEWLTNNPTDETARSLLNGIKE